MTEQEQIDAHRRIEQFLADPAIRQAIETVDQRITAEFKNARDEFQMKSAWAKSKALTEIVLELKGMSASGFMTLKQREEREAKQEAENRRNAGRRK